MKIYTEYDQSLEFNGVWIPKDLDNPSYVNFLQEVKRGEAIAKPYTPPPPTWEDIKYKREQLLKQSDWVGLKDVAVTNEQAWLNYRQELRDIPQKYTDPSKVVWPEKP